MLTLTNPAALRRQLKAMAALDAILSPEWEYRYYSFQTDWDDGEEMAGIRNGCGDDVYFLFNAAGCFVKGYAHEYWISDLPFARHYSDVPAEFQHGVTEPAFAPDDVSFCLWWSNDAPGWHGLETADNAKEGGLFMLSGLDGSPLSYQRFARDYFEVEVSLDDIALVFSNAQISDALAFRLNPELDLAQFAKELKEIGYPDRSEETDD